MASIYDFSALTLAGDEIPLGDYEGRVLLIVNTASACGFTPQYAGLEALYRKFRSRGFTVLGFPCNQFGGQEPGGESEIGLLRTTTSSTLASVRRNSAHALGNLGKAAHSAAPELLKMLSDDDAEAKVE